MTVGAVNDTSSNLSSDNNKPLTKPQTTENRRGKRGKNDGDSKEPKTPDVDDGYPGAGGESGTRDDAPSDINSWKLVDKRRKPKPSPIVGDLKNDDTTLKGVPRTMFLHVSKLNPDTTVDQVLDHLKQGQRRPVAVCEKLTSKFPTHYSSFKVGVPEEYVKQVMVSSCWPAGALVNRFFRPRIGLSPVE